MTKYHGGKQRIGAEIAQIIKHVSNQVEEQSGIRFKGYLEPFCGMLGVYQHIPELFTDHGTRFKYRAGDINESVIKMWKAAQTGWKPPTTCVKEKFIELRGNGKSSAEKGFIGHACSFRGIYFNMFFKGAVKKASEKIKNISLRLKKVEFYSGNYNQFSKLRGYIIYCDPPYLKGSRYVSEYDTIRTFDYNHFYEWIEKMSKYNLIFISERANLKYTLLQEFDNDEKLYLV